MNELLRLANELVEAREKASDGTWIQRGRVITTINRHEAILGMRCFDDGVFIVQAANHAVEIIKGYQELLRRVVDEWADYAPQDDLCDAIKESIPEEK